VLASTLTTLAVFLPVLFVEEEAGQLFRDIALAISAAVGLSLIISITLIPMATARLLGHGHEAEPAPPRSAPSGRLASLFQPSRWIRATERASQGVVNSIVETNRWIQRHLITRLAVVVGLVLLAAAVSYALWPKVEYL